MTLRYEVVITETALAEVEAIGAYIAADHPLNAVRFVDRLLRAIKSLGTMPGRCPLAPEGAIRRVATRNLIVGTASTGSSSRWSVRP